MNTPPEVTAAHIAATPKQRALAINLAKGMPKGDAMIAAGYSKAQAKKALPSVVDHPNVATMRDWYWAQAVQKNTASVERVMEEVSRILLADVRTMFDENGNVLDIHSMPDDIARCIAGIEVFEEFQGRGDDRTSIGMTRKVKFWNKLDAVEKLAKILGWYAPERHIHTIDPLSKLIGELQGHALPVVNDDPEQTLQ